MGLLNVFRRRAPAADPAPRLYEAVIAEARLPHWYVAGAPDTLDGRFDMVAAVLSMLLLRLEEEGPGGEAAALSVRLTELFVEDMDAQVRQIGFGDIVVGKHVGRMMSMLGGRLGAYRDGIAGGTLDAALVRNLWRGEAPAPEAVAHVRDGLLALRARLGATPFATLAAGAFA